MPNREADLARPRSRKGGDQQETKKGVARPTRQYDADPEWHDIAKQLWNALHTSGQADFYQDTDWAFAYSLMDDLSHYKTQYKRSGQMLQTIYSALERLLITEGDRRRVRVELEAPLPETEPAAVLAIAEYRQELGAE